MWPQLYVQGLAQAVARHLLGDDMTFDFDMIIYKAPHTDTETPWHQDESYWPDLPDKRSVSCWGGAVAAPLKPGSCTFHHGRTLHHTRGNTTRSQRRAYITNFRPCDMVTMERSLGFDHGKQGVDGVIAKGKTQESAQQPSV